MRHAALFCIVAAALLFCASLVAPAEDCTIYQDSQRFLSYSGSCLNASSLDSCLNGTIDTDCQCTCICNNNYGGQNCDIAPISQTFADGFGFARSFKRRLNSTALYLSVPLRNAWSSGEGRNGPNFTIEFWVHLDFSPDFDGKGFTLFETRGSLSSTSPRSMLLYSDGKFWFLQFLPGGVGFYPMLQIPYTLNSGQPYHLAFTSVNLARVGDIPERNRVYTLYINGAYLGEATGRDTYSFFDGVFILGTWEGRHTVLSPGTWWTGQSINVDTEGLWSLSVDEFRIWNRALTQTELSEGMLRPLLGLENGLLVYFPFNDGNETVTLNKAFSPVVAFPASSWNGVFFDSRRNQCDSTRRYSCSYQPSTYPVYIPSFIPPSISRTQTGLFAQRTIGRYNGYTTPGRHYGHACAVARDALWCFSGSDDTDSPIPSGIPLILTFNFEEGGWREMNATTVAGKKFLFHHAFTVEDNRYIYILGSNVFETATISKFDTEIEAWVQPPPNNVAPVVAGTLFGTGRFLRNRQMWLFGGGDIGGISTLTPHDRFYVLDMMGETWDFRLVPRSAPWPSPRMLPCMSAFSADAILMYGGIASISDSAGYSDLWVFNITTSSWKPLDVINVPPDKLWPSCIPLGRSVARYGGASGLSLSDALTSTTASAESAAQSVSFYDIYPGDSSPVIFRPVVPGSGVLRPTRLAQSAVEYRSKLYVYGGFVVDSRVSPDDRSADIAWDDRLIEVSLGCELGQGITQDDSCVPCPPGFYQSESYGTLSRQICRPCAAGSYQSQAGQARCDPCPVGTYQNSTGSAACTSCSPGEITSGFGANVSEACFVQQDRQERDLALPISVGVVVPAVIIGVIIAAIVYRRFQLRKRQIEANYGILPAFELDASEIGDTKLLKRSDIEVGEEIGAGSFGTVYRGKYRDKDVAIKVSKPGNREGMISFLREADVMQNVPPHKNCIQLEGVCMTGGSAWVVLEYVDGGSLEDLLHRGYQPTERELRSMVLQIVNGLSHLHSNNIIHRDLATRNILLKKKTTADDGDAESIGKYSLKISDFGMSRNVSDASQQGQTATTFGPVPWMSPEAIRQQYSPASDIWSLGVTIWEVVTGLDPSRQMPLPDLAVKIRDEGCWDADPTKRLSLKDIEDIARSATVNQGKSDSRYIDVGVLHSKKSKRNVGGAKPSDSVADDIAQLKKRLQRLEAETKSLEQEKARLLRGDQAEPVDDEPTMPKKDKSKRKEPEVEGDAVEMVSFAPPTGADKKSSGWRRTTAGMSALTNTYGPVPAHPDEAV